MTLKQHRHKVQGSPSPAVLKPQEDDFPDDGLQPVSSNAAVQGGAHEKERIIFSGKKKKKVIPGNKEEKYFINIKKDERIKYKGNTTQSEKFTSYLGSNYGKTWK